MLKFTIQRFICYILVFSLIIQPTIIPALHASTDPSPIINTEEIGGIIPIDEIVAPADYLNYMLRIRGLTKEEAEDKAWGEWMTTLTSAYMQMDDGASDVFSFYSALSVLKDQRTIFTDIDDTVKISAKAATMLFAFAKRTHMAARSGNLIEGFLKLGHLSEKANNWIKNNKTLQFMEFAAPPPCWNNPKVAGEGFKSYWRWVRKNTFNKSGKGLGRGKYISKSKGIARTLGIGMTLFGLAVDSYGVATSEDRKGDRNWSYSLVKNYAGISLSLASLAGMFLVPGLGQAAMIATGIWLLVITVGDILGSFNKRWKAAYKDSYWYLYENDPEFKSFYDNRSALVSEEKSACLLITERNYGKAMEDSVAPTDEGQKAIFDKSQRVYTALEKQGVLVSYYSQKGYSLPDFSMDRLEKLWKMKADFMSWKPTETEAKSESEAGFWGKIGHYVNPMTYASWAGNKIKSVDYKKAIKEYNVKKVFFNPDYVLIKKFQNYITARKYRGGIYDIVGLRMEQSPFNYAPLLGIDTAAWTKELLQQSFKADSFFVGTKELMYFREQIKLAKDKAKDFISELDKTIERISENDLPHTAKIREALEAIVDAYNDDPDARNDILLRKCAGTFGWHWDKDFGKGSPKDIFKAYKDDIEKALMYEPLSIAQKAVETVLLESTIKQKLDTAKMMYALIEDKQEAYDNCKTYLPNLSIQRYITHGEFLGLNKSFKDKAMSWLSEDYSSYDEMEKYLKLINDDVRDYTGIANSSISNTRNRWLWFDKSVTTPEELLEKLNAELESYQDLIDKFSEISDEIGIVLRLDESSEFKNKVFKTYSLGYEIEALDIDKPIGKHKP